MSAGRISVVVGVMIGLLGTSDTASARDAQVLLRIVPLAKDAPDVLDKVTTAPCDVVIVDVLRNGRLPFATQSKVFSPVAPFADGHGLRQWIDAARARGAKAYVGVDLLRWWTASLDGEPAIFERQAPLEELGVAGYERRKKEGRFASPFNTQVREALVQLARELGERYAALDGLYLEVRLTRVELLGMSEQARIAYIREKQIDPIDLPIYEDHAEANPYLRDYYWWRKDAVTKLVRDFCSAFRAGRPGKTIIARVHADYYLLNSRLQAFLVEDWMNWAMDGSLDEIYFELSPAFSLVNVSTAVQLLEQLNKEGRLQLKPGLVISGEYLSQKVDLAARLEEYAANRNELPSRLLIDPHFPEYMPVCLQWLAKWESRDSHLFLGGEN